MINEIKFWQIPIGKLKNKIRWCRCGVRLKTKMTECKSCHNEREYNKRKNNVNNVKFNSNKKM